ncbi:uncharacterized protein LOC142417935 [Mycteria americana]|uniref:uncharacterized protein LOC142417935 n=1 Tax=Mycteria americana TaxID=33587 RepID=UPI003F58B511
MPGPGGQLGGAAPPGLGSGPRGPAAGADFPGHLVVGKVQLGPGLRPGRVVLEPVMLDLGFVLPGDLLEAGGTVLPRRRSAGVCWCLPVFAGPVAPLENVTLSPAWVLVESRAWSQVLEDFAASLPLSRSRLRARRATARLSAPRALPVGSKGCADGLHCERESIQGSVSRETLAARECGSGRLLSDSRGTLLVEPWGARPLARGSRRCWTGRTGCTGAWQAPCVACGHVSTAPAQLWQERAVS